MATSGTKDIQNDIVTEIKGLVSYLHDVYTEGDKEELEVEELRRKLDFSNEDFYSLKTDFDKISLELNVKSKTLKHINSEIAIGKKKIVEIRNEIFSFTRLKGEVGQFAVKLAEQFDRLEKEYFTLTNNKELKTQAIQDNTIATKQAIESMAGDEIKIRLMKDSLKELNEQKKLISDSIGHRLSKTSLNRDEIEKELFALNQNFIRLIDERKAVNKLLVEKDEPVRGIRDEVARLTKDLSTLQDLKDIPGTKQSVLDKIEKLDKESKTIDDRIADVKRQIPEKQTERDALVKKNIDRRNTLSALEGEVGTFEQVYTRNKNTKESIDELRKSRDDVLMDMEMMLAESMDLEGQFLELEAMARAVDKAKSSILV